MYDHLRSRGIRTQVHYIPIHLQPHYRRRFGFAPGQFPVAEAFYEEALLLPLYPTMTGDDIARVVKALEEVLG